MIQIYPDPEILPPGSAAALDVLNARHETEAAALLRLEQLAELMDAQFAIPGTPIKLGLDSIIGLIPGIGDTLSLGISGFFLFRSHRLGARKRHLIQMGWNVFIDWLIGLIPLIGDLFDVGWRANLRNTAILREVMEARWDHERKTTIQSI